MDISHLPLAQKKKITHFNIYAISDIQRRQSFISCHDVCSLFSLSNKSLIKHKNTKRKYQPVNNSVFKGWGYW